MFPYKESDWIADWIWLCDLGNQRRSVGGSLDESEMPRLTERYFSEKYQDRAAACRNVLNAALDYVRRIEGLLGERRIVLQGRETTIPDEWIVRTLWKMYAARPDENLPDEVPLDDFVQQVLRDHG